MTLRTTAVLIGCVRAASGAMGVAGVRRATVHASASSAAKPAVLWLHGLGDTGAVGRDGLILSISVTGIGDPAIAMGGDPIGVLLAATGD